jgi:hypothetical protein
VYVRLLPLGAAKSFIAQIPAKAERAAAGARDLIFIWNTFLFLIIIIILILTIIIIRTIIIIVIMINIALASITPGVAHPIAAAAERGAGGARDQAAVRGGRRARPVLEGE